MHLSQIVRFNDMTDTSFIIFVCDLVLSFPRPHKPAFHSHAKYVLQGAKASCVFIVTSGLWSCLWSCHGPFTPSGLKIDLAGSGATVGGRLMISFMKLKPVIFNAVPVYCHLPTFHIIANHLDFKLALFNASIIFYSCFCLSQCWKGWISFEQKGLLHASMFVSCPARLHCSTGFEFCVWYFQRHWLVATVSWQSAVISLSIPPR